MIEASVSTKDRILDSAERLFAQSGLDAVSLRAITADAGVNLAAVNYHFQSKEALVMAVVGRRLGPVNRERMRMLDEFEREAGGEPIPVAKLLEAFLVPVLKMKEGSARNFVPLVARIYSEHRSFMEQIFREHILPVAQRAFAAFQRSLPHLPPDEVLWRIQFLAGAMIHTLGAPFKFSPLFDGLAASEDVAILVKRMIAFFTPAFQAPASEVPHAR